MITPVPKEEIRIGGGMMTMFRPKARAAGLVCLALLWALGGAGLAVSAGLPALPAQTPNPSPPASPVKLIFIHHSTGENWLADDNGNLGLALRDNNYFVSDTNYSWGPDDLDVSADKIGDHTDIGHWWNWFRGPHSATYLAALYAESDQHASYSRLAADPGGENRIILFKSCFPNSNIGGNPSDPPTVGDNPLRGQDSGSDAMTVANVKGIYNDLLAYFRTRPDKLFILVVSPPLIENDTDAARAANARGVANWLVNDWLTGYPYNNVAVFDFYNVLTSNGGNADTNDLGRAAGNHHRWWDGAIQHIQTVSNNYTAYGSAADDSHPTAAGGQKATGEFLDLLNIFYNRWQASQSATPTATRSVTATPTGSRTPTATRTATPTNTQYPIPTSTPTNTSAQIPYLPLILKPWPAAATATPMATTTGQPTATPTATATATPPTPAGCQPYPPGFTFVEVPDPLSGVNPTYPLVLRAVPAVGACFTDLRFGTLITRVTQTDGILGRHEYARFDPFNADKSMVLLLGDPWNVYRAGSLPYNRPDNLIMPLNLAEPRWDAVNPNVIWGVDAYSIETVDVSTGQTAVVKDFSQDATIAPLLTGTYRITMADEGESSLDKRFWALFLQGDDSRDYRMQAIFTWDRSADAVLGVYPLSAEETSLDWVGMSPLGNWVLIGGMYDNGGNLAGLTMANRQLTQFHRLDYTTSHADVGLDTDGNEVIVMQNYQTDYVDLIPLSLATKPILEAGGSYNGTNRTPLIRLYYASSSPDGFNGGVHVSCNTPGYCVVSTTMPPDMPEQNWLDRSEVLVRLDRSHPRVFYLAKLYNTTDAYWEETHGSITNDGSRVIWASNWGQNVGQEQVFMLQLAMPANWRQLTGGQ